jgi:hypothetical protein
MPSWKEIRATMSTSDGLAVVTATWPLSMLVYYGLLALDAPTLVAMFSSAAFSYGSAFVVTKVIGP